MERSSKKNNKFILVTPTIKERTLFGNSIQLTKIGNSNIHFLGNSIKIKIKKNKK